MDPLLWSILLVLAGFGVFALELFIPSAGLLGVVATALIIAGLVAGFVSGLAAGTMILVLTSLTLPLLLALGIKLWPKTPIGRQILIGVPTAEDVLPPSDAAKHLNELIGTRGVAKTKMLPSGIILIHNRPYDAVSDGFAIEPGTAVEVIAIRTKRLVVRPVDPDELPPPEDDLLNRPIDQLGLGSMDEPMA